MQKQNTGGSFVKGIVLGGILGAVGGMLLAPRLGSDSMQQLKEQGSQLSQKIPTSVREKISTLTDNFGRMQDDASQAGETSTSLGGTLPKFDRGRPAIG